MYGYFRNYGCRLLDFHLLGYRTVTLENELLRVTVLADKGACIYELLHKPSDTDFLWRWERGLRPQHYVESISHPRGSFQEHFVGGWDEMFPACGGAAVMGGLPIGYHGEVACLPWEVDIEIDNPAEVAVRFSAHTVRAPFRIDRTLHLRRASPILSIRETIKNESGMDVDILWGHHPCFGPPFLNSQCFINTGGKRTLAFQQDAYGRGRVAAKDHSSRWPYLDGRDGKPVDLSCVLGPEAGVSDCFYLTEFDDPAWYSVTNLASGVGIALGWSRDVMPYALMWQGFGGDEAAPWWGQAYVLAIEPLSSYPMNYTEAIGTGTARRIGPGKSLSFNLTATVYVQSGGIRSVSADGNVSPIV